MNARKKKPKTDLVLDERNKELVLAALRDITSRVSADLWRSLEEGGGPTARAAGATAAKTALSVLCEIDEFTPGAARAMATWMLTVSASFSLWADTEEDRAAAVETHNVVKPTRRRSSSK